MRLSPSTRKLLRDIRDDIGKLRDSVSSGANSIADEIRKHERGEQERHDSKQEQQGPTAMLSIRDAVQSIGHSQETAHGKKWYKDKTFLVSLAGVVVIFAYTTFAFLQWKEMTRAANASVEQFALALDAESPELHIKGITLMAEPTPKGDMGIGEYQQLRDKCPWPDSAVPQDLPIKDGRVEGTICIFIANLGRRIATVQNFYIRPAVANSPPTGFVIPPVKKPEWTPDTDDIQGQQGIRGEQLKMAFPFQFSLTRDELQLLKDRGYKLWVYGSVDYDRFYHVPDQHFFCLQWHPEAKRFTQARDCRGSKSNENYDRGK